MANIWQPDSATVAQLLQYLADSLSGRGNAQKNAEQMLKQAKASPGFENYLCYIIVSQSVSGSTTQDEGRIHAARLSGGILLKNNIKTQYKTMPKSTKEYLKTHLIEGLQIANGQIRNYISLAIAELVRQETLRAWPDAIQELMSIAKNENSNTSPDAQEGAALAIKTICEDDTKAFTAPSDGDNSMLGFIVQELTQLMRSSLPKVRASAVAALSIFVADKSEPILQNISEILRRLLDLATDPDANVRQFMCRAIIQLAEADASAILDVFDGLVDFMISQQTNQEDAELAVDAAEFWLFAADNPKTCGRLAAHVEKIVPILLENMIYSEDDQLQLEDDEDDAHLDDRTEDMKPQFATSKASRSGGGAAQNGKSHGATGDEEDMSEGEIAEDEDDDEDDEDEDGADPEEQWTLRKCSAASLDTFSNLYPDEVFEATLPFLQRNMTHEQWPNREAAVLAIGAIAEGCMDALKPHLPELIPFLVRSLRDKQAIVRQISCWSLGRYSEWASHLDAANKAQIFVPMLDGLLRTMLDNNKKVQEAAASAFANLEEKSNVELADPAYCSVIVKQFIQCFAKYKERSIYILYDCIQTLSEHVIPSLQDPSIMLELMPALYNRWQKTGDYDQEMFPLLECLSYVATPLGQQFAPYAQEMFPRCNKIIYDSLQKTIAAKTDPDIIPPQSDFLVTSLDLLSAIIQGLGENASVLIQSSSPSLFEMLEYCLQDENCDVKQSAYALLGDAAIHVFSDLAMNLDRIVPILIKQIESPKASPDTSETGHAVTNNACWSCGEITMRAGSKMAPFADVLIKDFYSILDNNKLPNSLQDNAALALGRLGNGCADKMAPHISFIGPHLFRRMKVIGWEDEKCHAMRGISEALLLNLEGSQSFLFDYVTEVGSGSVSNISSTQKFRGPQGPYELFQKALSTLSQNVPHFKSDYLALLPPNYAQAINDQYRI